MLLPANIRSGKEDLPPFRTKMPVPAFLQRNTRNKSYHLPALRFHFRIINHVCDHCPDYHVKQSKSDKCKNIKCNVDPHIIRMNDQTQKITDRTDQTCCSREFFLSKSGCQFPARGAQITSTAMLLKRETADCAPALL